MPIAQTRHIICSLRRFTFADDYRNAKKGRKPLTRPAVPGSSQNCTGGTENGAGAPGGVERAAIQWKPCRRKLRCKTAAAGLCGGPEPETFRQPELFLLLICSVKALVPVLCIVLLILVVKLAKPESGTKETRPDAVETMESTEAAEQETESTGPVFTVLPMY